MTKLWTVNRAGKPLHPMGPITSLTVHCTADVEGRDVTADQISQTDMNRADLGYQVGYHYVITLDGTVHNTCPETLRGAHIGGHNTGSVGLSYVGGLDRVTKKPKDTRTREQKKAMAKFITDFKQRHPGAKILGHRDWSPDLDHDGVVEPNEWVKACPCFSVGAWIAAGMPIL